MSDPAQPSRRLWWATLAAAAVLLLLSPLTLVDVPLLDYPNHLARLFVPAHPDDPVLSKMYAQHWTIVPNLAIDLPAPPLLRVPPVHGTGRTMIGLTLLLPVIGCAVYGRAVFGLAFFGLMIGSAELAVLRARHRSGRPLLGHCARRGAMLAIVCCAPVVLYLSSLLRDIGGGSVARSWAGNAR